MAKEQWIVESQYALEKSKKIVESLGADVEVLVRDRMSYPVVKKEDIESVCQVYYTESDEEPAYEYEFIPVSYKYIALVSGKFKFDYVPNDDGKTFTIVVKEGVKTLCSADVIACLLAIKAVMRVYDHLWNHGDHVEVIMPQYVYGVTAVKFPAGFERIEMCTFTNPEVKLDANVEICPLVFDNLSTINIPRSLKYIGKSAFYKCNIQTIISEKQASDCLVEIGDEAFAYNYSLNEFNVPTSFIGNNAFYATEYDNKIREDSWTDDREDKEEQQVYDEEFARALANLEEKGFSRQ